MRYDENIILSEHKDGFWLWDKTLEMNLAVRAKTKDIAYHTALHYYQTRLKRVEAELKALKTRVDAFIDAVRPEDDY